MPSADFWPSIPPPLDAGSPFGHYSQISPGIARPPSRLCLSDLRRTVPCKFRALMSLDISPRYGASYPLPVRQASALPSSFLQTRSRPRNPCLRLTLPPAGRVEDFHLQVSAPCRAHQKKARDVVAGRCGVWAVFTSCPSPLAARWTATASKSRSQGRRPSSRAMGAPPPLTL